jgi:DNA polymerase-3 subunit alpha
MAKYRSFFTSSDFALPNKDKASVMDRPILSSINDLCEEYNILSGPMLPTFPTPKGESEGDYLKELCRKGWTKHLQKKGKIDTEESKKEYLERFLMEFEVIEGANLFGYFLIVWDILNFVNKSGWLSGVGRGSAAGCLVSYLIEITKIDPVELKLLFERFYSSARNTEGNVSLPDIDIDVPSHKRDEIIEYLKVRYGRENVSQMITLTRYRGRSALKEVLRVYAACGFAEMNAMTDSIPDEAAISDQLEQMDEEDRSIIRWSLIHNAEDLRPFCHIDEEGNLQGDYAMYFELAIRLEGTFRGIGKHAAGIVISKSPLHRICPMKDQDGVRIAALEMKDLEACGHVKLDLLGVTVLSKLMRVQELVNGKI